MLVPPSCEPLSYVRRPVISHLAQNGGVSVSLARGCPAGNCSPRATTDESLSLHRSCMHLLRDRGEGPGPCTGNSPLTSVTVVHRHASIIDDVSLSGHALPIVRVAASKPEARWNKYVGAENNQTWSKYGAYYILYYTS
jgi:hypothetical protein